MIETELKRLADAAERIVAALERSTAVVPPHPHGDMAPTPVAPATANPKPGRKKAAPEPTPEPVAEQQASFLDDDEEEGEPVTKEDVKKALVAAQGRLTEKLKDAQKGMVAAMKILADTAKVDTLRKLPDDQKVLRAVIAAADAA